MNENSRLSYIGNEQNKGNKSCLGGNKSQAAWECNLLGVHKACLMTNRSLVGLEDTPAILRNTKRTPAITILVGNN